MSNLSPNNQPQVQVAHDHPTMKTFVNIGLVLAVITAVEFGIISLHGMRGVVIAVLAVLSLVKFYLVISYFMHLKFDAKVLTWVFVPGVLLATGITTALRFILQH